MLGRRPQRPPTWEDSIGLDHLSSIEKRLQLAVETGAWDLDSVLAVAFRPVALPDTCFWADNLNIGGGHGGHGQNLTFRVVFVVGT